MPLGEEVIADDLGVALRLEDQKDGVARVIDRWKEYEFNTHFLTPTDGWHFTLGNELLSDEIRDRLEIGARVSLWVNGHAQATGFIDDVIGQGNRHAGEITIVGRDLLAPVVDSQIDPQNVRFSEGQTLFDVLFGVFSQFGWPDKDLQYLISNDANRNVITGAIRGIPTGKGKKHKPLKSFVLHQLKPYPHEGAFAFAARLAQRHGQWIWVTCEGNSLVISTPDFDQAPRHHALLKRGDTRDPFHENNVEDYYVARRGSDQPSIIIAYGFAGGAEFSRSAIKVACINEITGLDEEGRLRPEVSALLAKHQDARLVGRLVELAQAGQVPNAAFSPESRYPKAPFRPLFLCDDESKTLEQLESFVLREMALKQRGSLEAHYTFEGHENNGNPWAIDCIVDVDDDVNRIHENLWCIQRTFFKSRNSGTKTRVELIRPHTLEF